MVRLIPEKNSRGTLINGARILNLKIKTSGFAGYKTGVSNKKKVNIKETAGAVSRITQLSKAKKNEIPMVNNMSGSNNTGKKITCQGGQY